MIMNAWYQCIKQQQNELPLLSGKQTFTKHALRMDTVLFSRAHRADASLIACTSAISRNLQSVESAHKHTTAELQRTRNLMQSLRSTHNTEIKKLEKEKERVIEKWSRLSDSQIKAAANASGMRCANLEVVESPELQLRGKGQNFLEVALDQAEQARKDLFEQHRKLRGLIVNTANELQRVAHSIRDEAAENQEEVRYNRLWCLQS